MLTFYSATYLLAPTTIREALEARELINGFCLSIFARKGSPLDAESRHSPKGKVISALLPDTISLIGGYDRLKPVFPTQARHAWH